MWVEWAGLKEKLHWDRYKNIRRYIEHLISLSKIKQTLFAPNPIAVSISIDQNIFEGIDGPDALDAVPESIESAISDGIDLNGAPLPKEMVGFYKEVMQKEADRICRVRVAMRKKIIATGSKHFDQETLNKRLIDAGWEGLKAAEIAYFFS